MLTLRVDNQAISWLKTYSLDQANVGRWILALEYIILISKTGLEHKIGKSMDFLSDQMTTNGERKIEQLTPVADKWNFFSVGARSIDISALTWCGRQSHTKSSWPTSPMQNTKMTLWSPSCSREEWKRRYILIHQERWCPRYMHKRFVILNIQERIWI